MKLDYGIETKLVNKRAVNPSLLWIDDDVKQFRAESNWAAAIKFRPSRTWYLP
jgi:hypothetical protein